jgi:hypothetical protein
MLAYPTPRFDAKTILEGPGYRPTGKSASYVFNPVSSASTPQSVVNKKAYNSRGFTGTRAEKFIQDNQFLPPKRAPGEYPLSTPGYTGNEFEGGYAPRPTFAEPKNAGFQQILGVLNNKPEARHAASLTPAQIKFITAQTLKAATPEYGGEQVARDLADSQTAMARETRIRNAMGQGFTREEATIAYNKLREEEAKTALFKQQSLTTRFADLVDSRLGGDQNGANPSNDESSLYIARNKVGFTKADEMFKRVPDLKVKKEVPFLYRKEPLGPLKGIREDKRLQNPGRPSRAALEAAAAAGVLRM